MAFLVLREVVDEGDQLDVGAVLEDDELIFSLIVAMSAAGADAEMICDPATKSV